MTNSFPFRWHSSLGLSVALFLLYAALNLLSAVCVPLLLHLQGAGAVGGALVLSNQADTALLGRTLAELHANDPAMGAYLVSFMDTMCAQMMAFSILQLGVVWFALRKGQLWALWTTVVADLAVFPYYFVITQAFLRFGVSPGDVSLIVVPAAIVLLATVLGGFGLRKVSPRIPLSN